MLWPARTYIALWADTLCRIQLQQNYMSGLASSRWEFSARTDSNSAAIGTLHGRSALCAWQSKDSSSTSLLTQQMACDRTVQVHGIMQLFFRNELALGVGHMDGAWPHQHRRTPLGEGGNVRGVGRHHGLNAGNGAQLEKRNFQYKLCLGQPFDFFGNFLPQKFRWPDETIEKLG